MNFGVVLNLGHADGCQLADSFPGEVQFEPDFWGLSALVAYGFDDVCGPFVECCGSSYPFEAEGMGSGMMVFLLRFICAYVWLEGVDKSA